GEGDDDQQRDQGGGIPGDPPYRAMPVSGAVSAHRSATPYPLVDAVSRSKLQCEVKDSGSAAEHLAQIEAGLDHPNLIANPSGDQRRLRIVENDAFLAVEPALALVDLGDDSGDAERQDLVLEQAGFGVEYLALPGKMVDEPGDLRREPGSGGDDRGALSFAIGNVTDRAAGEQLVQLRLRHSQKLLNVIRHVRPSPVCHQRIC